MIEPRSSRSLNPEERKEWCPGENICCKDPAFVPPPPIRAPEPDCETECSEKECHDMADLLEGFIDQTVNPCEDFFAYACSSKTRGSDLPGKMLKDEDTLIKFAPKEFKYVEKFYRSCTNISDGYSAEELFASCIRGDINCTEDGLKQYGDIYVHFLNYTKEFFKMTEFPAVNPNWERDTEGWFEGFGWSWWDVSAVVLKDHFYLGAFHDIERDTFRSNIFFAPLVNRLGIENKDTKHIIHIVPMTIPQRLRNQTFQESYKPLVKGLLTLFGADSSTVGSDTDRIIEMEQELLEIGLPESWDKDQVEVDNLTIRELATLVPSVPWRVYMEAAFSHKAGFKVTPSDIVAVPDKRLMKRLGDMLENLSERDRANLLIWRMFIRFTNDFMKTGMDNDDLQRDPFTQRCKLTSRSRAENCLCQVNTLFPDAHNDLLIAEYIDATTKQGIKEMFHGMAKDFEQIIDDQKWMSHRTKLRAKQKVANMGINVGEQSPNTPEFQELKKKMKTDNYISNILAIGNYHFDTFVKLVGEEVKEPRKQGSQYAERQGNAFYYFSDNEMLILTGLITSFLGQGLSFKLPKGIIYGGHGGIIGHEMVHGFDNEGKTYDKDGYKFNWWTKDEEKNYTSRTQCLADQYSGFSINYENIAYIPQLNGIRNQGENIADNGGLKAAFHAYKNLTCLARKTLPVRDKVPDFTSDQLFWVGHALNWCTIGGKERLENYTLDLIQKVTDHGHFPAPWRVNTVFSNMPEFAEAFQCPLGSRLNPEKRCPPVW